MYRIHYLMDFLHSFPIGILPNSLFLYVMLLGIDTRHTMLMIRASCVT